MTQPATGLTPLELAAISLRVPCSGTPAIDALITQSLRFQATQAFVESLIKVDPSCPKDVIVSKALSIADGLLSKFQGA